MRVFGSVRHRVGTPWPVTAAAVAGTRAVVSSFGLRTPGPGVATARVRWAARRDRRRANPLQGWERSRYSQNGQDGILQTLFERIGVGERRFVEIGAADGAENCTRALLEDGWSGVWVEGDPGLAASARGVVGDRPVAVAQSFVDATNVGGVVADALTTLSDPDLRMDLLVVDVDGNDYWIVDVLVLNHRPRVVVVEYNAALGPVIRWTMRHNAAHTWDHDNRHGASLGAFAALLGRRGYRLVGCDSLGVNAFFVRSDVRGDLPSPATRSGFSPARYALPGGHPWRFHRLDLAPVADPAALELAVCWCETTEPVAAQIIWLAAAVTNRSPTRVGVDLARPVNLTWQWLDEDGQPTEAGQPHRIGLRQWSARPGQTVGLPARVRAPETPGRYTLRLRLVQENVVWFDPPGRLDVPNFRVVAPAAGHAPT